MTQAVRDQNHVPSILATLNTDGRTSVPVKASPDHRLKVNDGVDGSDNGPVNANRDENHIPVMMAASSEDGSTPVVLYADADGKLLVQTT